MNIVFYSVTNVPFCQLQPLINLSERSESLMPSALIILTFTVFNQKSVSFLFSYFKPQVASLKKGCMREEFMHKIYTDDSK